jgi:hypothetical protein
MKYRLAKDFGVFSGEFKQSFDGRFIQLEEQTMTTTTMTISNSDIPKMLKQGVIKEVQEKEYTKDDMIEFCLYVREKGISINAFVLGKLVEQWQEQRK